MIWMMLKDNWFLFLLLVACIALLGTVMTELVAP